MTPESERELVARARRDPEAFGDIFDAHYDRIFAYALKRTGSADVAADITAETFMKAMKGLALFRWRGIPLAAWLYRIAGNECNMYFRKGKYAPVSLSILEDAGYDPEAEVLRSEKDMLDELHAKDEKGVRVIEVLRMLPSKYQEVLALRFVEGKKTGEIARILGKREGTVRSLISRGVSMIREKLAPKLQQKSPPSIMKAKTLLR